MTIYLENHYLTIGRRRKRVAGEQVIRRLTRAEEKHTKVIFADSLITR